MIKQEFEMINGEWLPVIKEVADEEIIDNRSRKERIIERRSQGLFGPCR